jgi:hypothetical protein
MQIGLPVDACQNIYATALRMATKRQKMIKENEMIEELVEYLIRDGYQEGDSNEIHDAYYAGGIDAAVEKFRWADEEDHDYTGELREVIKKWQKEIGEYDEQ